MLYALLPLTHFVFLFLSFVFMERKFDFQILMINSPISIQVVEPKYKQLVIFNYKGLSYSRQLSEELFQFWIWCHRYFYSLAYFPLASPNMHFVFNWVPCTFPKQGFCLILNSGLNIEFPVIEVWKPLQWIFYCLQMVHGKRNKNFIFLTSFQLSWKKYLSRIC